jgi:dihydrofolate reductase
LTSLMVATSLPPSPKILIVAVLATVGVTGSVDLTRSLIEGGLLDRLHLLVHPVVLGSVGRKRMFGGYEQTGLRLLDTAVLDGRVARLTYEP